MGLYLLIIICNIYKKIIIDAIRYLLYTFIIYVTNTKILSVFRTGFMILISNWKFQNPSLEVKLS